MIGQMAQLLFQFLDIKVLTNLSKRTYQKRHDSYCLIFAAKGTGNLTIIDHTYKLQKEQIYICPPQESITVKLDRENTTTVYLILFDSIYKHQVHLEQNHSILAKRVEEIQVKLTEEIANLTSSIYALSKSPIPENKLIIQAQFYMLIHALITTQVPATRDQQKMLEKTKHYMQVHFREQIQIKDLAKMMHISPKYYMELFRKRYGISAIQYLSEIRIEASKNLLLSGGKTLKEIAKKTGYKDEFYFSRRFKEVIGIPPSLFMKRRMKKIAVLDSSFFGILFPLHFIPSAAPIHPTWRFYYFKLFGDRVPVQLSIGRSPTILNDNIELLLQQNTKYDLILCLDNVNEKQLTKLKSLGHVHQLAWSKLPWREQLLEVAKLLDANVEARRWLDEYERTVQEVSTYLKNDKHKQTFLFLLIMGDDCYLYHDRSINEVLFEDLKLTPATAFMPDYKQSITVEQLAEINSDYILTLVYEDEETLQKWNALQLDETWLELKSVRNEQVYTLNHFPWRDYAALPHLLIVKEVLKLLTEDSTS
ncbi:helix-turn-helix domain-containing protein [Sporosarcina sp. ACRSM]|uniref:helix-turn-helix domain-containing protein n=1 Tax=Sporosarcina sp. ACRSM TaxID=2918216 RepID=UPI001EF74872|nr:helix-turn-helix domain-containing protein [Sporosarcina sp. ACRSM]MCG7337194.1 helix-turn-helix domain-containing protein [Sporosarcina sp. ACRSM]